MSTKTNETVGYKKPPKATQFKPGISGNPSGRPKKPVNIASELLDELGELTSIRDHGRQIEITKARAIVKEIVQLAAAGDLRAATTVLSFTRNQADTAERSDDPTHSDLDVIDNFVDRELISFLLDEGRSASGELECCHFSALLVAVRTSIGR